jgi:putative membrane protein
MKSIIFCTMAALGLGLLACGNGENQQQPDAVDSAKSINKETKRVGSDASDFAMKAANGGMMEVELGKVARDHAASQRIRAFGDMMVRDHSQAGDNLKSIASSLKIALPDSISNDEKKEIDQLKMKKGKAFDKAYVEMMVDDHKKDIDEFKKCAADCSDSTIRSFAANTLPVLQKHLDSIQAIASVNK